MHTPALLVTEACGTGDRNTNMGGAGATEAILPQVLAPLAFSRCLVRECFVEMEFGSRVTTKTCERCACFCGLWGFWHVCKWRTLLPRRADC